MSTTKYTVLYHSLGIPLKYKPPLHYKTGYRQVLNTDMKLSMTQHFDRFMTRYLWFFSGQSLAESWALYFLC